MSDTEKRHPDDELMWVADQLAQEIGWALARVNNYRGDMGNENWVKVEREWIDRMTDVLQNMQHVDHRAEASFYVKPED